MANTVVQQINTEMEELQRQLTQFKSTVEYLNNAKANVTKAVDAVKVAEQHFNQRVKELGDTYHSFIQLSDAVWAVVQKIDTVNFPERLDTIETTLNGTIKNLNEIKEATIIEVQRAANVITQADFEGKFLNLQKGIDVSVKANLELTEGIHKLKLSEKMDEFEKVISKRIHESYKEVEKNTRQIAEDTGKSILNLNLPLRMDKLDANIAAISSGTQNIQGRLDLVENNIKDRLWDGAERQAQALDTLQERIINALTKIERDNSRRAKNQQIIGIVGIALIIVSFIVLFIKS
jgi:hypothetical protein